MNKLVQEAPYHPGYEDAVIKKPMTVAELIEQLDDRYGNPYAVDCKLIQDGIKALRELDARVKELENERK